MSRDDLLETADTLRDLLEDRRIPDTVRAEMAAEFEQIDAMLGKLDRGELHIGVLGRVSVGKTSLLNALVGQPLFSVSPLHGETRTPQVARWEGQRVGGLHLIDTPGLNELDGEERETMALEVASRVDLLIFVVEGDLTQTEHEAVKALADTGTPIILALNKADRYSDRELGQLEARLTERLPAIARQNNIVTIAADPRPEKVIRITDGAEREEMRPRPPAIEPLIDRVIAILEKEGLTLAAVNAGVFAGRLSDEVARRLVAIRRELAEKTTRFYCLTKGLAVAVNPIPIADLAAAATVDVIMVRHLSQIYGLPMTASESGQLVKTIALQMALLMGTAWGVHLLSSTLKGLSAGFSVALIAGLQGGMAWYTTYLVGRAAEEYLMYGKSWGDSGPKRVVRDILKRLDRDSILAEARNEILARIKQR